MKSFVNLAVLGNPEALMKFLPAVESLPTPEAHRDLESENRCKERSPDSHRRFIRWRRFSDDLTFPIEQNPEAICFDEVFLYPGKIVPAPGFPPLLADFFYRFVKPVADRLALKCYSISSGQSAIEIGIGWSVALQLLTHRAREATRPPGFISRPDADLNNFGRETIMRGHGNQPEESAAKKLRIHHLEIFLGPI